MLNKKKTLNKTSDLTSDLHAASRKELGLRIRKIWQQSGLKQEDFSNRLDISSVTLSNYMKGLRSPDVIFINKITSELNVCIEWIMTGQGPMRKGETVTGTQIKGADIDKDVLTDVVMALEDMLQERAKTLPPKAKAEVIYELYMLMIEEEAEARKPSIMRLVRGALAG